MAAIESLPTEILVKIFRYIPSSQWGSLEIVSEKFRDTINESWKTVEKIRIYDDLLTSSKHFCSSFVGELASKSVLENLATRATNLTEIGGLSKLFSTRIHNSDGVCSKLAEFARLRRIRFDGSGDLYLYDLTNFLRQSEARDRLIDLSVSCCIRTSGTAEDHLSFADAFRNVHGWKQLRLETLNLRCNWNSLICRSNMFMTGIFLETIDTSRLTTFLISNTFVPRQRLADFLGRASNLERFSFSLTCYDESRSPSASASRNASCRHGPDGVPVARNLHAAILRSIGRLERLESLSIGTCEAEYRCDCIKAVASQMGDLFRTLDDRRRDECGERIFKELDLSDYAAIPEFVTLIADHLPNLDSLSLRIDHLDDQTLKRTLQSQMELRKLQLLNYHVLGGCAIVIEDFLINASTLESLTISLPSINSIRGDLRRLGEFRGLKKFRFDVRQFRTPASIDGSILTAWGDGFGASLESFEFGGNYSVTNGGVREFLTKASKLEMLRVNDLALSDAVLMELPTLCPLITELILREHPAVTLVGVQHILDRYPRLKTLEFRGELMSDWFPGSLRLDKFRRVNFGFAFVRY